MERGPTNSQEWCLEMNLELEVKLLEIKRIYLEIMNGDVIELYSSRENELEVLFNQVRKFEIDSTAKPLVAELVEYNKLLIQRLNMEKKILTQERELFEKQKHGVEQYSNPQKHNYESYFIDKKR